MRQSLRSSLLLLLTALATVATAEQHQRDIDSVHARPTPTKTNSNNDNESYAASFGTSLEQCSDNDTSDECAAAAAPHDYLALNAEQHEYQQHLEKRQEPSARPNVPQNAPQGGLSMTQPPLTAQATFYKIAQDNLVTFGWVFTDVLVQPEYLTLQAYCSQNGYTYPVGPTQGIAGDATEYAWNPYEYERSGGATPLAEASYTLRIFDERGYGAAPSPGMMRSYAGSVFALYRPQKYVALADGWVCAACSAAMRVMPVHPALSATLLSVFAGAWLVFARI